MAKLFMQKGATGNIFKRSIKALKAYLIRTSYFSRSRALLENEISRSNLKFLGVNIKKTYLGDV